MRKPKQAELFPDVNFKKIYIKEQIKDFSDDLKELAKQRRGILNEDDLEAYYEEYILGSEWWVPKYKGQ